MKVLKWIWHLIFRSPKPQSMTCIVREQVGSWQVYIQVGRESWAAASGKHHVTKGGALLEATDMGYIVVEDP